jgi:glycosyltransferase involved in cell wall biosynthesis
VTPEAAAPLFAPKAPKTLEEYPFERWSIRRPYILAVGNLQPRKNLLRLIEAFAQLITERRIPHQLVLAGKAKWRESDIHRTVRRLGIEDRIVFTGRVPDEDLACLLNGAELFVYPSLYEGFGLPVLEAMACGTPVVTSNCTSIPEVAGDAALLVDPYRVDELADAIHHVLSDESLRARLREKGLARSQMFSWRQTARKTWTAYCQTAGSDPA